MSTYLNGGIAVRVHSRPSGLLDVSIASGDDSGEMLLESGCMGGWYPCAEGLAALPAGATHQYQLTKMTQPTNTVLLLTNTNTTTMLVESCCEAAGPSI